MLLSVFDIHTKFQNLFLYVTIFRSMPLLTVTFCPMSVIVSTQKPYLIAMFSDCCIDFILKLSTDIDSLLDVATGMLRMLCWMRDQCANLDD